MKFLSANPGKEFYTMKEAAALLGYHVAAICNLVRTGDLEAHRIKKNFSWLVPRNALATFCLDREVRFSNWVLMKKGVFQNPKWKRERRESLKLNSKETALE